MSKKSDQRGLKPSPPATPKNMPSALSTELPETAYNVVKLHFIFWSVNQGYPDHVSSARRLPDSRDFFNLAHDKDS